MTGNRSYLTSVSAREANGSVHAAPPSPSRAQQVAYLTGVNADGSLTSNSSWGQEGLQAHKWGSSAPGTGATIFYTFDARSNFTEQEKATFRAAFELWESVANVTFVDSGAGEVWITRGNDRQAWTSFEYTYADNFSIGTTQTATISIDTRRKGFDLSGSFTEEDGYGLSTVIHEVGHLLGLGHGGPYDGTVNPATQQYSAYDERMWTIMSYIAWNDTSPMYRDQYPVGGTNWGTIDSPLTMMQLDIEAVQRLYGVPSSFDTPFTGGQRYGFNTNITGPLRKFFDFTQNTRPVITLYNQGRANALDVSGFSQNAMIRLMPGAFSSFGGLLNNLSIAIGTNIEALIGGGGDDIISGHQGGNWLMGGAGNDLIFGGNATPENPADGFDAADTIYGEYGNDVIYGNAGGDTISAGRGLDTVYGGLGNDLIFGGHATPAFTTDALDAADTLYGNDGNDIIHGNGGGDIIYAGGGLDVVYGGEGNDLIYGGDPAADALDEADTLYGNEGNDVIHGQGGGDIISAGSGFDTVYGGSGNDLIFGGNATPENTSDGLDDADTLYGNDGNDIIYGNAGGDTIYAGSGFDTVHGGMGNDLILGGDAAAGGPDEADTLYGNDGNDIIYGNAGGDIIDGGAGYDTIDGGVGNDVVAGGADGDTLSGGSGLDFFLFNTALGGTNVDAITDFVVADDLIGLEDAVFTALPPGYLVASAFTANASGVALDATDRLIYETDTGYLYYDADGNSGGASILFARLAAGLSMTAADFLVV